ncbi:hypothetical protein [Bradyrhizobium sp. URHD0069]|nr:hypothetical protein [Bradyrhizobium sp. URHD0069]
MRRTSVTALEQSPQRAGLINTRAA